MQATSSSSPDLSSDARRVHILARSLFREMRQQGFTKEHIIGVSTELSSLVNEDLQKHLAAQ